MTTATSAIDGSPGLYGTAGARNASKELNDRFLKLLVAQMNNQDPLNPLDNAQVTSQMAQINTVTGINNLSETVAQMVAQFAQLQSLQAAQLTGRSVMVAGSDMTLGAEGDVQAGFELQVPADSVKVEVRDANGLVVREITLGAAKEGIQRFAWDGTTSAGARAAAGRYTFGIKATASGKEIDATALTVRQVEGVLQNAGTVSLILSGLGPVAFGDIRQIL
ncbi:flagellar hook assembly protein FlgD [Betaproteobacteria bacterium PRO7]|jgi:flagellar basal-body rod modification protein FlgD|nr:flagellar hook assembly protein FlgD [Betaproteobacteria bacterium PRO7]